MQRALVADKHRSRGGFYRRDAARKVRETGKHLGSERLTPPAPLRNGLLNARRLTRRDLGTLCSPRDALGRSFASLASDFHGRNVRARCTGMRLAPFLRSPCVPPRSFRLCERPRRACECAARTRKTGAYDARKRVSE